MLSPSRLNPFGREDSLTDWSGFVCAIIGFKYVIIIVITTIVIIRIIPVFLVLLIIVNIIEAKIKCIISPNDANKTRT